MIGTMSRIKYCSRTSLAPDVMKSNTCDGNFSDSDNSVTKPCLSLSSSVFIWSASMKMGLLFKKECLFTSGGLGGYRFCNRRRINTGRFLTHTTTEETPNNQQHNKDKRRKVIQMFSQLTQWRTLVFDETFLRTRRRHDCRHHDEYKQKTKGLAPRV